MAENLTRKILKEHLVEGELRPGEPIALRVDPTLLQDATGTMSLMQFEQLDVPRVKVDRAVQYVCHYVHIERYAKPGDILVGADSHTTTSGALGMIAIGAGGLDVAVAMGGYPYEIACPEVVEVYLENTLQRPWLQSKDIILELLRQLSASGGKNKIFEFAGPRTADLPIPARATIPNMIAERG